MQVTSAEHLLGPMLNTMHLASQGVVLTSSMDIPRTVKNAHCLAPAQTCLIRASGCGAQESAFEHRKTVRQQCHHITLRVMKPGFSEIKWCPKAKGG